VRTLTDLDSQTVVELLSRAAARLPNRPALIVEPSPGVDEIVTFDELWDRVDRASCGLTKLGIAADDRAVIMIPMSIDLYVVLLAVLKLGASAIFVDPWMNRHQIAAFAAFAEPKAFLGIGKSHLLRLADAKLRRIPISLTTGRAFVGIPAAHQLSEIYRAPGNGQIATVDRDATALITFTSGSSGQPKGANRTHGYLCAQHHALQAEFPYSDDDVDLTNFPVFALNNLARGITTVVPSINFAKVASSDGRRIVGQLRRNGVTTITASPPLVDALCATARSSGRGGLRLRRILSGGAPIGDAQLRSWREALPDAEWLVIYGSTEAEPVAHVEASERLAARSLLHPKTPGFCAGVPVHQLGAKVVRIHLGPIQLGTAGWSDWELLAGEIGELVVCGEHVGKSYFRNPGATAENKIQDPSGGIWHRMGDTGYFDERGCFWLTGRLHSIIRRDGLVLQPQLIEQAALGDDANIKRVAAVGYAEADLGQRVAVVLESTKIDKPIAEAAAERIGAAGITVDELVLTTQPLPVDPRHNSKIDYDKIRDIVSRQNLPTGYVRWKAAEL
jgi:acyl-CoA synthetase (AMP-forming)/AMP-acid ligase II